MGGALCVIITEIVTMNIFTLIEGGFVGEQQKIEKARIIYLLPIDKNESDSENFFHLTLCINMLRVHIDFPNYSGFSNLTYTSNCRLIS